MVDLSTLTACLAGQGKHQVWEARGRALVCRLLSLPKQKGAVVMLQPQSSYGTASLGAGGWKKAQFSGSMHRVFHRVKKMTIVFCPCGGRTNSVSLLYRTAPSALARRTGHRPQPHRAEGGSGEAATAAVCCHGGPSPQLPVVPEWEPAGTPEEKKTLGNVALG